MSTSSAVVINPQLTHKSSFILLHGLGDSGHGWSSLAMQFRQKLPNTKFIFPHAPAKPVTLNGGMVMPSWYDIRSIRTLESDDPSEKNEDIEGFESSKKRVLEIIESEIKSGIPLEKIGIGGFSQGGAVSLYTLLSSTNLAKRVSCVSILSSYVPCKEHLEATYLRNITNQLPDNARKLPLWLAHGKQDPLIPIPRSSHSYEWLKNQNAEKRLGLDIQFHAYDGLGHSANELEISDLEKFLVENLGS